MSSAKDLAKRRRSGMDMVNSSPLNGGDSNGLEPQAKAVKTRLPKIARSSWASGIWARKTSPAGIMYLKMEDEVSLKNYLD